MEAKNSYQPLNVQLRGATRYGLYGTAKYRKAGIVATSANGQVVELRVVDVEQIINELDSDSRVDYDGLVQRLIGASVPLNLQADQLLKLRSILLLGLGQARNWQTDTNARKSALARTYPRGATGRYQETFDDTMRDDLLRQIAEVIESSLKTLVPTAQAVEGLSIGAGLVGDETYITTHYEGHRVEPTAKSPFRNSHRRTIKALRDGVTEFRQNMSFSWTGASMPEHFVMGPGDLKIENLRELNWSGVKGFQYELVVTFKALNEGQTRQIAWDVTTEVNADYFSDDAKLKIFGVNPRGVFEYAKMSARFAPDRPPAQTWRLDGIPRDSWELETVGDPDAEPEDYVLEGEWTNLRPGRVYGLRWRWGEMTEPKSPSEDMS